MQEKSGEKQFSVDLWYFAYYQNNVLALIVCFFSLFSLHYHWTQIVCMYACSLTSIRKPSFDACWKNPENHHFLPKNASFWVPWAFSWGFSTLSVLCSSSLIGRVVSSFWCPCYKDFPITLGWPSMNYR